MITNRSHTSNTGYFLSTMNLLWSAVLLSVSGVPSSNAFVSPIRSDFSSSLFMGPPSDPSAPVTDFGEGSRKNRRTVCKFVVCILSSFTYVVAQMLFQSLSKSLSLKQTHMING